MKFRIIFLLVSAFLFISFPLRGQREQLSFRTEWFASSAIDINALPRYESGKMSGFSSVAAWADRSVLDKKGTRVLTSTISYRYTQLDYDLTSKPQPDPAPAIGSYRGDEFGNMLLNGIQVHHLQADLLLMSLINSKWILYSLARPALMSDLENDLGINDFRLEAAVFGEYRVSSKLRIGPGLSRSSAFGRVLWIPLMRVLYRPAPKVLVDGILPSRLDVWYLPNKTWEFGFGLALNGGQYRFNETNGLGGNQFGFANGLAMLQAKRLVSGKWFAQLDAGLSIVPRQELSNYDYNLFPKRDILVDLSPDPIPVVRFGVFKVF